MTMGCCGRRVTALGLLAEADAFPPSHPRGAWARRRIAYSVAAQKARQAGNRHAYERAMAGLNSLGTDPPMTYHGASTPPAPTAADAAAAGTGLQNLVGQLSGSAAFRAQLSGASGYINLVLGAAQLGTGIASSACNGCDRTGIDAVNLVISLVRTLISGGTPIVPTMSVETLNGFVSFCVYKEAIKGIVQAAFGVALLAAARDSGATSALTAVQSWILNLLDGICNIPQIQMAIAALTAPPPTTPPPAPAMPATQTSRCWNGTVMTQTWDPATQRWGMPTPACPPPPPAAGLESGAGGCTSGRFNLIPPAGIYNPTTQAAVPGTAGAKSCAACSSPSTYIPGRQDGRGFWASPPGCLAPSGRIISGPTTGPCPAGTSRGSDGVCAGRPSGGGGGGGGGGLLFFGAAALAAKLLLF